MPSAKLWESMQADTAAAQPRHHDLGSGYSRTYQVRKRAMLRAIARAKKHPERGTWYRNRWHSLQTLVGNYRSLPTRVVDTESRPRTCAKLSPNSRRFRTFTYNVGGLSTDAYDELMVWASSEQCLRDYDALVLTETRWKSFQEFESPGWYAISTGASSDKSAGILILVRRTLCASSLLQSNIVVPGRVIHVLGG